MNGNFLCRVYGKKACFYGLLTRVTIKQNLPFVGPFTYFIQIVIELIIRKIFVFNFWKCDISSKNILNIDSIPLDKSII